MMKKKKILLVGAGQLGSRHLQGCSVLEEIGEIQVVDPNLKALDLSRTRLDEAQNRKGHIEYTWLASFEQASQEGDLCIVATQAEGRPALIQSIVQALGYRRFFIEKIVAQSVEEYQNLLEFCAKQRVQIWVNCKTRTYLVHQYIKSCLNPLEPLSFQAVGGNNGLGNNGIHEVDLFAFYDGCQEIQMIGNDIQSKLQPSKRGPKIFDLCGSLHGATSKGSQITVTFLGDTYSPDVITIFSPSCRFLVDHFQKFAFESHSKTNWEWKKVPIDENWNVSHMTTQFVKDILNGNPCHLPTLEECWPAHQFILSQLLPHFNRLLHKDDSVCPIT